jgi:3-methyl-2-oxobutanoate hydroxymethyltransferase
VLHDALGLSEHPPKLAKAYTDLRGEIDRAVREFADDVTAGRFPDEEHSYT